jgi:PKHD-type hydroxylase
MVYNAVVNNPLVRRRVSYDHIYWDNAFSTEELCSIEKLCDTFELNKGTTFGSKTDEQLEKVRKSYVNFFNRYDETAWIFDRFNYVTDSVNRDYFGFNLNGYESIQYTVYKSDDQGKYDWHMDTDMYGSANGWERETRKLTIVMLLSEPVIDFSGGELQINRGKEEEAITLNMWKGRIVAFPSFMLHRVKPVYLGVRKSLVIWIEGPKFV